MCTVVVCCILLHVHFADEGKGFAEFRRGDALEIK
jgi:hypothetical protein